MYYRDDWDGEDGLVIDLKKGYQHLDSNKAIQYVRYRDEEGDIGRVARQQKFIKAVSDKMLSFETIPKLPAILQNILGHIETDFGISDMLDMAKALQKRNGLELHAVMVPGYSKTIDKLSYWIIDKDKLKSEMQKANDFILGNANQSNIASTENDNSEAGLFKNQELIDVNSAKWTKDELTNLNIKGYDSPKKKVNVLNIQLNLILNHRHRLKLLLRLT